MLSSCAERGIRRKVRFVGCHSQRKKRRPLRFHSMIVNAFETSLLSEEDDAWRVSLKKNLSVKVVGGGLLRLQDGKLQTYGSSFGYGPIPAARLADVKACLLQNKQNLPVGTVEVTNYIRD